VRPPRGPLRSDPSPSTAAYRAIVRAFMVVGMNSISGVFAPVITPFNRDLSPDPDRLIRHCRWLLASDVGLAVFGTNSEGNSLSVDERIGLLDALIDAGLDPARMMPGTGCSAFTDTVRLTAHDDDLYLFAQAPDDGSIVRQAILANPLVVMAHPSDPLARERSISLERLAQAPLLLREAGSGTRASVIDLFACAGLTPNVRMELASDEAIRCAVGEGAGIAVLARDTFALEGRADAPVMLDVAGFPLARHWHFAYPVAGRASRAVQAFMRHVRDEVALLPCGAMSHGAQAMAHGSRILQALPCEAQVPAVRHGLFAAVRQKSLSSIHLHSGECSEWRVHRSKRLRPE